MALIQHLMEEHRGIEAALERLAESAAAGRTDGEALEQARRLCAAHYAEEEEFLRRVAERDAALAAKLRGQHEEVMEIASRMGDEQDWLYLARRMVAMAQHNIIEEERDVFPAYGG